MYKLLNINGVDLSDPEGDFSIKPKDKYNEYEGEDGGITVEAIRQGIVSLSVSFKGLFENDLKTMAAALKLVSTLNIYNPTKGEVETITAKITNIAIKKQWYKNELSVWSLSFDIDEL